MKAIIVCVLLGLVCCAAAASADKQPAKRGVLGLGYGLGNVHGLGVPAYGHGLGLYSNGLYDHGWSGHGLYGAGLYGHGLGVHAPLVAAHAPLVSAHAPLVSAHTPLLSYPPLLGLGHGYIH